MNEIKSILIPTDYSPSSERAADYAVRLAEGLDADVVLVHVFAFPYDWYYWEVPGLDALRSAVEMSAEEKLRALAMRLARPGVSLRTRLVVRSDVTHAILDTAREEKADLIVVGTTGWTGERPQLGSVAEQVARRSDRKILMVHATTEPHSDRPRVLVPVDQSEGAATALRLAARIASSQDGHLAVLHVLADSPFLPDFMGDEPVDAEAAPAYGQRLREIERFLQDVLGEGMPADVYLAEGDVVEETARCATNEEIELIVLGISDAERSHKAERLALAAPCPVLAVPGSSRLPEPPTANAPSGAEVMP